MVGNRLKTWEKTIVTDRAQGMQRESVRIYGIVCFFGTEVVKSHALGTQYFAGQHEGPEEEEHRHISNNLATH